MSNDENYLESFIETITTLPGRLKRNLEHIHYLDTSWVNIVDHLVQEQDEYIQEAGEEILSIPVARSNLRVGAEDEKPTVEMFYDFLDNPNEGAVVTNNTGKKQLVLPTTEELRAIIHNRFALAKISKYRNDAWNLANEKVATAEQTYAYVNFALKRLDADIEKFECLLKESGQFEFATIGGSPDDLAAIQVTPNSPDWILAKVISHDIKTGKYILADEDIESNKTFTLPESQVVILGAVDTLACGDIIYSVYPDTTSFYQATVVQSPHKLSGSESFVMVHFKDDSDENGVTHDKAVLMKHVMRVPFGKIH